VKPEDVLLFIIEKLDEKYLLHFAKLLSVSSLLQKLFRGLKNSG